MIDLTPKLAALHAVYCQITDRAIVMSMHQMFQWQAWLARGYVEDDLRLVVAHIKRLIKENRRRPESFRFYNLIGDTDRFGEDLAEARALNRRPASDTGRQRVLRATGRSESNNEKPCRSAAQVLRDEAAFKEFQKFKEQL